MYATLGTVSSEVYEVEEPVMNRRWKVEVKPGIDRTRLAQPTFRDVLSTTSDLETTLQLDFSSQYL